MDWRSRIDAAEERIAPYVRRTPVLRLERGAFGVDARLMLKLEQTQHAGSFKARGAVNQVLCLRDRPDAVVAASGGNHGAAVAYAAQALGIKAEIFAPETCGAAKQALIRAFGARLTIVGAEYAEAADAAAAHAGEIGAPNIHAYDAVETIAGQGTMARELQSQVIAIAHDPLDSVLVATGGGGLVAGVSAWFEQSLKVTAVEPESAPTYHAAKRAGRPVAVEPGGIAADALGARQIGDAPWSVLSLNAVEAVLTPDAAIREAQRRLWTECRILTEPAAAAPLAALLCGAYQPSAGERIGLVICGANVALESVAAFDADVADG